MSFLTEDQLKKFGIVDYGYTTDPIPHSIDHYNQWVKQDHHLPLEYLAGDRQKKRQSIKEYWPDFESALTFLFSYHEAHLNLQSLYENNQDWNGLKLASYTLGFEGLDYHHILLNRLNEIGEFLIKDDPSLLFKVVLDTHPVLERDLAMRAGLGWFGKNSMLINRSHGSFFIIGSLLLNHKLKSEISEKFKVETDHCGQCTKCIDACPTNAIDPVTRTIKSIDCISTFTIEQFKIDSIPGPKMTLKEGTLFGCDICQDVCPWNKRVDRLFKKSLGFSHLDQHKILNFFLLRKTTELYKDLFTLTEGGFRRLFRSSSFERSGRRGLLKSLIFYLK
jgi:epoxyqueuosine reductase